MGREKILAIKFKYLGDVALMIPALRMLRAHYPDAEIHALIAAEAEPLLKRLPWIDRVWPLTRSRGKVRLRDSLPIVRQLRAKRFDRSVDFVGNDRGALLSRMIGARERLGVISPKGFAGRTKCYTQAIEELDARRHESTRDAYVLSAWGVPFDRAAMRLELTPEPACLAKAEAIVPKPIVIGHLSTSQSKKEWPVARWVEVAEALERGGHAIAFTSGPSEREQALLKELADARPQSQILRDLNSLELFIAVLARARLLISPDTAPLHLAAGLGVPTLGLFGPTSAECWSPPGPSHTSLVGDYCLCSGHLHTCAQAKRCLDAITPAQVIVAAQSKLEAPT